jgi:hypothetical protein
MNGASQKGRGSDFSDFSDFIHFKHLIDEWSVTEAAPRRAVEELNLETARA